jgi:integrase
VERAERDEWVFHAPGDVSQPASDKHVSRRARRALDSIGLERAELYDLKHTCLTNLGRAGASLKELMDLPGHSQIETVLKYQLSDFERVASAVGRMANNLK